jgi:hypothetical protein
MLQQPGASISKPFVVSIPFSIEAERRANKSLPAPCLRAFACASYTEVSLEKEDA